jgi:hypothetical protein
MPEYCIFSIISIKIKITDKILLYVEHHASENKNKTRTSIVAFDLLES